MQSLLEHFFTTSSCSQIMKPDLHRKIELATNIAIMVFAALLCAVLVKTI